MQETWVRSLGREDPLEEQTATHSSILSRQNRWTKEPGGLYNPSTGLQRVGHSWATERAHSYVHPNSLQWVQLLDPTGCNLPHSSVRGSSRQEYCHVGCARVGCRALLQGIFPTQGRNPHLLCLLHWQVGSSLPAPSPNRMNLLNSF